MPKSRRIKAVNDLSFDYYPRTIPLSLPLSPPLTAISMTLSHSAMKLLILYSILYLALPLQMIFSHQIWILRTYSSLIIQCGAAMKCTFNTQRIKNHTKRKNSNWIFVHIKSHHITHFYCEERVCITLIKIMKTK